MAPSPTVLVVDDSLSVRKVVERALESRQIRVLSAALAAEAIERLERDEPDAVVCDVLLPDKDGYHVCDFVRRHPRLGRTPVLLISGIVNEAVLERARAAGSDHVLRKPFTGEELARTIGDLLAARSNGHPAAASAPGAPADGPSPHTDAAVEGGGSAPAVPAIEPPARGTAPPPGALPGAGAAAGRPGATAPALGPAAEAVPWSPAPSPPSAPRAPAAGPPAGGAIEPGLAGALASLAALAGVRLAVVADREGFLVETAGAPDATAEVAGALAACLAESSEGLGRELGQGALQGLILEYERGLVLLQGLGPRALLAVQLQDPAALGKVRYYARKAVPELLRAL
jgi:CheY-like chemotaxis protein